MAIAHITGCFSNVPYRASDPAAQQVNRGALDGRGVSDDFGPHDFTANISLTSATGIRSMEAIWTGT